MPADPDLYRGPRLAQAYAFARPPLHAPIWARIVASGALEAEVGAALDLGCGAGASTAPLPGHAKLVTGLDASEAMLGQARRALPEAGFVLGTVESLPFDSATFDLVTAAGSLNYADPRTALAEIARVLRPGGRFVAYDFSTGRPPGDEAAIEAAFRAFRRAFPPLPGYALDLGALPYVACGLERIAFETFTVEASTDARAYVDYLVGETSVDAVIAAGMDPEAARAACSGLFEAGFDGKPRTVRFAAVFAIARKLSASGASGARGARGAAEAIQRG